ncbi:hypothetical protein [Roseibium aggregatum]|uniref:Uncharacterized protein n=1 Tax=Roseibium aggregatum TaxID=187304 RepID=A0A0M6Y8J3_9HYPH|nr:hypothetical protein [Roseibium aggregatum]CTQ45729.1 hypothetical protein LAL4801_04184 [Roseibium aggregatum]
MQETIGYFDAGESFDMRTLSFSADTWVVRFTRDGRFEINPEYELDEASAEFVRIVEQTFLDREREKLGVLALAITALEAASHTERKYVLNKMAPDHADQMIAKSRIATNMDLVKRIKELCK